MDHHDLTARSDGPRLVYSSRTRGRPRERWPKELALLRMSMSEKKRERLETCPSKRSPVEATDQAVPSWISQACYAKVAREIVTSVDEAATWFQEKVLAHYPNSVCAQSARGEIRHALPIDAVRRLDGT
jgi:hypothetical protein